MLWGLPITVLQAPVVLGLAVLPLNYTIIPHSGIIYGSTNHKYGKRKRATQKGKGIKLGPSRALQQERFMGCNRARWLNHRSLPLPQITALRAVDRSGGDQFQIRGLASVLVVSPRPSEDGTCLSAWWPGEGCGWPWVSPKWITVRDHSRLTHHTSNYQ